MNPLSLALTIFVILLLIIDIVYRIKTRGKEKKEYNVLKEFFHDYKDQLSWTRLALTALLLFAVIVVVVGLIWPKLWDPCKETFNAVLEWCKWLFGISKTPEAVNQVSNMIKPPEQK